MAKRGLLVFFVLALLGGCRQPSVWDGKAIITVHLIDREAGKSVLHTSETVGLIGESTFQRHIPQVFPAHIVTSGDQVTVKDMVITESYKVSLAALSSSNLDSDVAQGEDAMAVVANSISLDGQHAFKLNYTIDYVDQIVQIATLPNGEPLTQPILGNSTGESAIQLTLGEHVSFDIEDRFALTIMLRARI